MARSLEPLMSEAQYIELCQQVEDHVKQHMAKNDPSHDFAHVQRVRQIACRLADETVGCMFGVDKPVVELAALLHDSRDHKYTSLTGDLDVHQLLSSLACPQEWTDAVCEIVDHIGFASYLADPKRETTIEFDLVSDADRLDAIGAIGVARCFSFGAARQRPMCCLEDLVPGSPVAQPTPEEYLRGDRGTTFQHFHEKLLKLCGLMRTDAGRRWAQPRHEFLKTFVKQFAREYQGEDFPI